MRRNHIPWRAAGTTTEQKRSADEVVRETGWVFNNQTGSDLNLAEFVETGNHETLAYLTAFGLEMIPMTRRHSWRSAQGSGG